MSDIKKLQDMVLRFRNDRDWKQYHNPKDLAIALLSEATELLDEFKWKSPEQVESYLRSNKENIADEVADVLYYVLLIANDLNIDIVTEFERKMIQNEEKYPIEKAFGSSKKYTEFNTK